MSAKQRIDKTDNVYDDFNIKYLSDIMFDEINILVNGKSLKRNIKKINFNIPTFQINFFELLNDYYSPIFITADGFYFEKSKKFNYPFFYISPGINKNSNIIPKIIKDYDNIKFEKFICKYDNSIKNNLRKIFDNKNKLYFHHKSDCDNLQIGSALTCILFLSMYAKKTNIFGWDQYLEKSLIKNHFFQYKALFGSANNYRFDIFSCFATAIFNFYYSSRLGKHNIIINSFISSIHKNKSILKRIEKIIYNNK